MKGFLVILFFTCFWANAQNLDQRWVQQINNNRNINFDDFNLGISQSADYVAIATPATLLLTGFIKDNKELKQKGIQSAIAVLGTYGVTYLLKNSIKRERPYISNPLIRPIRRKDGYSMPSGSAAVAFASATSLTSAYPKWYVAVPSYGYAGAVAFARVRSGEHYPSDVFAGAVIGAGSVWVSQKLTQFLNKN
jgi:membrane-associated phospholipid phosphatase